MTKSAVIIVILATTMTVHCIPGWFGGKQKGPEYEINPNFGFRSYHQIRYEPMTVPFEETGYGGDQGYGGGQGGDYGGGDGGYGPGDMPGYGGGNPGPLGPEGGYGGPGGDAGYGMGPDMGPGPMGPGGY
ncbi:unnamed protein product [Allacma fusca]|uniref:Glycine-rich protein n=1 Tax=Allacma fusca TaxID=39272 RepID=A0A8J2PCE0_9HEXA|nr:unnamed protein product [Allacma fusca]